MSLSGGQKQRLAVATALLSEKPVLIFDEPTSGLDYARMVEVSEVIRDLARQGRIVLVVTHDQEFMQRACDRNAAALKGGEPMLERMMADNGYPVPVVGHDGCRVFQIHDETGEGSMTQYDSVPRRVPDV